MSSISCFNYGLKWTTNAYFSLMSFILAILLLSSVLQASNLKLYLVHEYQWTVYFKVKKAGSSYASMPLFDSVSFGQCWNILLWEILSNHKFLGRIYLNDSQKLGTKYSGIQTQSLGENNESMNSFTTHIRIRISDKSLVT